MFIYMNIYGHECEYGLWNSKEDHEKNKPVVAESVWGDATEHTWPKIRTEAIKCGRIEGDEEGW